MKEVTFRDFLHPVGSWVHLGIGICLVEHKGVMAQFAALDDSLVKLLKSELKRIEILRNHDDIFLTVTKHDCHSGGALFKMKTEGEIIRQSTSGILRCSWDAATLAAIEGHVRRIAEELPLKKIDKDLPLGDGRHSSRKTIKKVPKIYCMYTYSDRFHH